MGTLQAILCDATGNRVVGSSTMFAKSGRLTLSSIDEFPDGEAVFGGNERANLQTLNAFQTLRFVDADVGAKLAWHLIHDPSLAIQDTGDVITLTVPNATDQLTQYSLGVNASYQTTISSMVSQIGAQGETVEWLTFQSATGQLFGYRSLGADLIRNYDANGNLVSTFPGTGKFTGWSAVALDDGPNIASVQPVTWGDFSGLANINANNVAKKTGTDGFFDCNVAGVEQIAVVTDQNNVPAHGDGALQWQVINLTSEYVCGLASPGQIPVSSIRYGIHIVPSAHPLATLATGTWQVAESGVYLTHPDGTPIGGSYQTGDIFRVAVDYSSGTAHIIYYQNATPVYTSAVLPSLPLAPLISIATPGGGIQNATLFTTVKPSQQYYQITFPQQTPLEGIIQLCQATGLHVRQRRDPSGVPLPILEVGRFGEQSGVRLVGGSVEGGVLERMLNDPTIRVVTAMNWKQETSQVINTIAPLGANSANGPVTLERAWQIVNDPNYINYYKKFGTLAATFPEYDGTNYPIKRTLVHGTGQWEYYVQDIASYTTLNMEIRGKYEDAQFSFTDTTDTSMDFTCRALYLATVAKLKVESQVNDVLEIETVAGKYLPPKGGSRILMDFKRISGDVKGNFVTMNTQAKANLANPYVIAVERQWAENGAKKDVWRTSAFLRPANNSTSSGSASLRALEAIKIVQNNSVTYLPVIGEGDVDANPVQDHSLIVEITIPEEVFRITRAPLDVTFSALRQQVTTAANPTQQFTISIPMNTVTITSIHDDPRNPYHVIPTLSGGSYNGSTGFITTTDPIAGAPAHIHRLAMVSGGTITPTSGTKYLFWESGADPAIIGINNFGPTYLHTNTDMLAVDTGPTKHPHRLPINRSLSVPATLTGVVDQQTINANLPAHTHPIQTNLNDVSPPSLVDLYLDAGDGVFQYLSNTVPDAHSGGIGPWSSSFSIADLSRYLANARGKKVRIKLTSLDTGGTTFGIGHLKVTGLWKAEIGGLGSQVQIAN